MTLIIYIMNWIKFFVYFVVLVCVSVFALVLGVFDALHISPPEVFASLGAIAVVAFSAMAFVNLRKMTFIGKFGSLWAALTVVGFWGLVLLMALQCDAVARMVIS